MSYDPNDICTKCKEHAYDCRCERPGIPGAASPRQVALSESVTRGAVVKPWQERMPAPRTAFQCVMNCSGAVMGKVRETDCGDCMPITLHGDQVAARDAEIKEWRAQGGIAKNEPVGCIKCPLDPRKTCSYCGNVFATTGPAETDVEAERASFEAWAGSEQFDLRRPNKTYASTETSYAWQGWLAARTQADAGKADTERLDWLEAHCIGAGNTEHGLPFLICWRNKGTRTRIRPQIDLARTIEQSKTAGAARKGGETKPESVDVEVEREKCEAWHGGIYRGQQADIALAAWLAACAQADVVQDAVRYRWIRRADYAKLDAIKDKRWKGLDEAVDAEIDAKIIESAATKPENT